MISNWYLFKASNFDFFTFLAFLCPNISKLNHQPPKCYCLIFFFRFWSCKKNNGSITYKHEFFNHGHHVLTLMSWKSTCILRTPILALNSSLRKITQRPPQNSCKKHCTLLIYYPQQLRIDYPHLPNLRWFMLYQHAHTQVCQGAVCLLD